MIASFFARDCATRNTSERNMVWARKISRGLLQYPSLDEQERGRWHQYAPHQLVPLLSELDIAAAFSESLFERSLSAHTLEVEALHIQQAFQLAFRSTFGSSAPDRIGLTANSLRRVLYNTLALLASRFHADALLEQPTLSSVRLKNCVRLVVELTGAVKFWLPESRWLDGWSDTLALMVSLELQPCSALRPGELSGDAVFRQIAHVLFHDALNADPGRDDLQYTNPVQWISCSKNWSAVLDHMPSTTTVERVRGAVAACRKREIQIETNLRDAPESPEEVAAKRHKPLAKGVRKRKLQF